MKKSMMNKAALVLLLASTVMSVHAKTVKPSLQAQVQSLEAENAALKQTIKKFEDVQKVENRNLKQFDDLDYIGWTGKNLKVFEASHDENVHVEGMMSAENLVQHSGDAKKYYPYLQSGDGVTDHPIKIAQDDWTVVVGATQSTVADAATGGSKKAKGFMLTLAKWANGKITEEYLFKLDGDASKSWLNKYMK